MLPFVEPYENKSAEHKPSRLPIRTIWANYFFVCFSAKCKGIRGDIWTTISTNLSIPRIFMVPHFLKLTFKLFPLEIHSTLHAGLTTIIAQRITSILIRLNISKQYVQTSKYSRHGSIRGSAPWITSCIPP